MYFFHRPFLIIDVNHDGACTIDIEPTHLRISSWSIGSARFPIRRVGRSPPDKFYCSLAHLLVASVTSWENYHAWIWMQSFEEDTLARLTFASLFFFYLAFFMFLQFCPVTPFPARFKCLVFFFTFSKLKYSRQMFSTTRTSAWLWWGGNWSLQKLIDADNLFRCCGTISAWSNLTLPEFHFLCVYRSIYISLWLLKFKACEIETVTSCFHLSSGWCGQTEHGGFFLLLFLFPFYKRKQPSSQSVSSDRRSKQAENK